MMTGVKPAGRLLVGVAAALCAAQAQAATTTSDLQFSATSSLFGGAPIADFQVGPGKFGVGGIAEVKYAASASTGTVDAKYWTLLTVEHPETLSFTAAAMAPITLELGDYVLPMPGTLPDLVAPGGIGSFNTNFGVGADVSVELFKLADVPLLNIDGQLATSASGIGPLGTKLKAEDTKAIASAGKIVKEPLFNSKYGAKASVYIDQSSELDFGDLVGTVQATHESGAVVTESFALSQTDALVMDLQMEGVWQLALTDITVEADFESEFGFSVGGKACFVGCAKIKSGALPFGSASFDLPFSSSKVLLDTLLVLDEDYVIPLPAGLPLLLGGLGCLAIARRRRNHAA